MPAPLLFAPPSNLSVIFSDRTTLTLGVAYGVSIMLLTVYLFRQREVVRGSALGNAAFWVYASTLVGSTAVKVLFLIGDGLPAAVWTVATALTIVLVDAAVVMLVEDRLQRDGEYENNAVARWSLISLATLMLYLTYSPSVQGR